MKILSLFDGISCGRVALERAGIKVDKYYASEIDKYAIQITQKNYPDTIQLGDVNNYENWDIDWDSIDLLIGGSPCQDLSIAKKDRKGLEGQRSSLFWKYVEILQKAKPKYFLLENVASMPKEAKEIITETLGVEPILINSALVSAQQRKRLYWTNIPNITQPEDKGIVLKDILINDKFNGSFNVNFYNNAIIRDKSPTLTQACNSLSSSGCTALMLPVRIGQFNNGGQGDRIYSVKGKSVSLNANGGGRGAKTGLYKVDLPDGDYIIRKLYPIECERLQTLPDNYTEGVSNSQRYKAIGNGWTVDVIAHIFSFI